MKFIDHTTVSVQAGNGGMGCIAVLREKHRPKGGPCGGDGGHGGNVFFSVNSQLATLQDISLKNMKWRINGSENDLNECDISMKLIKLGWYLRYYKNSIIFLAEFNKIEKTLFMIIF